MTSIRFRRQNMMERRISLIDAAITDGAKSRAELEEILGKNGLVASHATVSRDLQTLKDWGGNWKITSDFKYYYPEPSCSLSYCEKIKVDSTKLTQNVLELLKGSPFYEEIVSGVDRANRRNSSSDRIIFLGAPMAQIQSEVRTKHGFSHLQI